MCDQFLVKLHLAPGSCCVSKQGLVCDALCEYGLGMMNTVCEWNDGIL